MSLKATSDLWWKTAVVYCIDVEAFLDADGDGCGDFKGLTESVDYLAGLGVTCVWLLPFYPSPNEDYGYDVTDFYGIDPRLGSLGDFVEFVRTARDRGIRVMVDLVVNHTSIQHPWFQHARADRRSPYRDYYIWRDALPRERADAVVFPDVEDSKWQWDPQAGQFYLHHFYRHQADLNVSHPAVLDEIHKVIGFWLQLGVAGFRVDAVPFLFAEQKVAGDWRHDPHQLLRALRAFLSRREGDAVLLGEVNLPPAEQLAYFGGEGHRPELHMAFNFALNQALYLALARHDAGPLREALAQWPEAAQENQWANFVRNHDELTLDQLAQHERDEVYAAFAPGDDMRIYGRGIRRRLPGMLGGDRRRIEMVYSLMFSLPGTPVLLYGEEVGMGDDLSQPGRVSVRTAMQWSAAPNAGFSTEDADRLCRPLVTDARYGPQAVNVADQRRDPDSLLNWMERLIRRRKECPEMGWGHWQLLDVDEAGVLAHRCDWEERSVLALHNLSEQPCTMTVKLDDGHEFEGFVDLLGEADYRPTDGAALELDLDGYGYRWLRLHRRGHRLHI